MKKHLLPGTGFLLALGLFIFVAIRVSLPQGISSSRSQSPVYQAIGKAKLISPSGNISTTTPTYTWSAVAAATWYRLWVNDSALSPKIYKWYKAEEVGCASGTSPCSITPNIALAAGACRWWVQTDDDNGPWSDPMDFTVSPGPPPKANLYSPSGNTSTANPTFAWQAVSSAT